MALLPLFQHKLHLPLHVSLHVSMDGVGTYERACIETASASSTVLRNYRAGAGLKEAMLIMMKLRSGMLRPVPTTPAAICHRSPAGPHSPPRVISLLLPMGPNLTNGFLRVTYIIVKRAG